MSLMSGSNSTVLTCVRDRPLPIYVKRSEPGRGGETSVVLIVLLWVWMILSFVGTVLVVR